MDEVVVGEGVHHENCAKSIRHLSRMALRADATT
jgi:hypothetical protein